MSQQQQCLRLNSESSHWLDSDSSGKAVHYKIWCYRLLTFPDIHEPDERFWGWLKVDKSVMDKSLIKFHAIVGILGKWYVEYYSKNRL